MEAHTAQQMILLPAVNLQIYIKSECLCEKTTYNANNNVILGVYEVYRTRLIKNKLVKLSQKDAIHMTKHGTYM